MSFARAARIYSSSRATLITRLDQTTGSGERRIPGDGKTQQGQATSANLADSNPVQMQTEEVAPSWLVDFDPGVGYEEGTSSTIKRHAKVGFYSDRQDCEVSLDAKEGLIHGNDKMAGSDEPVIPSEKAPLELDYLQEFPDPNEIMRVRRKSDANATGGKLTASSIQTFKAQTSASLTDLNLGFVYRTADQNGLSFLEGQYLVNGDFEGTGKALAKNRADIFDDSYLSGSYGEGFCGENTAYERMNSAPDTFSKFKFQKVVLEDKAEWEDNLEFRCRKYSLDERGKGNRKLGNGSSRRYSRQNSAGMSGTVNREDTKDCDLGMNDAVVKFDKNNRRRSSLEVLFGIHNDEVGLPDNSHLLPPPLGGVAAINPIVSNWTSKLADQATTTTTTDNSRPSPRQRNKAPSPATEQSSISPASGHFPSNAPSENIRQGSFGAGAFEEGVGSAADKHQHQAPRIQRGRHRPSTLSVQVGTRDAETITDVCSGGNIPEVEIISLVEEQIPKYKLRADTITDFAGYENADWGPACKADLPILDLSPEQIRETLNYFLLCANRVSQMTRTYNDIEAVSRLLEEKEKDLELTARIGKELLDQNQGLKVRLAALEVEIRSAHEGNTQIRHELQQKTQLLHALTSDEDGSLHDHASPLTSPSDTSLPPLPSGTILGNLGGKSSARASVELLKRRVSWLEDENKSLRMEASQLARETQRVEEEEAKLVEGVAQQLASVSEESRMLSEELERVRNEGGRHREEVDILLEKLAAAQEEIRRLRQENEELSSMVIITRENQDRLTTELADFKERHGEVMCLLNEAQENLRKMRQKELPSALSGNRYLIPPMTTHHGYLNHFGDSIASELESSLNSELSLDSGIHMPDMQGRVPHYRKVFETVRSASRSSNSPSPSPLHRMPSNSSLHHQQLASSSFAQLSTTATLSSSSMQTCRVSARPAVSMGDGTGNTGYRNSFSDVPKHLYGGLPNAGFYSLDSAGQSEESDQSGMATDSDDCLYPRNANMSGRMRTGVPGSPGAKELQAALVQMAKQEHPALTKGEKSIGGYEGKSRGSSLDVGPHRWSMSSASSAVSVCHALPYGCRTPDSIMSTGSSRGSRSSWRMPEKLQIVKPKEGSLTLGWWSRLATPSLSAALEERPGVKVRGGVNDSIQQHTLMDLEEDDSMSVASGKSISKTSAPIHPGKFFQGTASVYTYTNSTVLHPDNVSCVPPSPMPQSPAPSSPTQQQTPNLLSRRSSISTATPTFSTALGLAKMLHERGISASSSENDLSAQAHFTSATATPCNSPDESPFSSRSPSPDGDEFDPNPIASLISSGAELLRRSLGGGTIPPPPSGALQRSSRGRSLKRNNRPPIGSLSRSDRKALAGMKLVEKLERIGLESIMAYSQPLRPFQGLVPLTTTLQVGTMYARPAVKSPMAQLTSLKSTLRSRSTESHDDETDGPSPAKQRPKPCRRQDLGTVPTIKKVTVDPLQVGPGGARGTISAIFFGRKGGLM